MGELLLELLSEEIPARMQRRAIEDLIGLVRDRLAGAGLPAAGVIGHVTPRRLVVIADGIPARQPDREEERRGPRVGAPQPAIDGFLRAAGFASIEQCEQRETDRGAFYFAVLKQPGRAAAAVLPELIHAAVAALPWPKSMRFPAGTLRWVRPLNSVICLFDGEVVALPLDAVPVGRATQGHRFLSPGEISVSGAADYLAKLERAHVVLDRDRRRAMIEAGLTEKAAAAGLAVKADPGLLEEVTGLVEYPVVLMGHIDPDFVRPLPDGLPPEVLATAMRAHQKYFTCLQADGTPAPRFLFVANNVTPDGGKTIAAGNERVLRARLSDARFFWDQDRKVRLEGRVAALKERVYHEKLGSVYDKVERMETLAAYLATHIAAAVKAGTAENGAASAASAPGSRFRGNDGEEADSGFVERCRRAARLAKADLSSGMVGEFPELQGIMGRYYALGDGEDPRVADAIADHYKPLGPNDTCPTAPESIVVALADKIDALAAFFSVGEKPTGSGDPFALRRAAQGVIRIILENELRVSLASAIGHARSFGEEADAEAAAAFVQELLQFLAERIRVHLRDRGVRHDILAATMLSQAEDNLLRLLARLGALEKFLDRDDGANLLAGYRRASNIVQIEERRDRRLYRGDVGALKEPEEKALADALGKVSHQVQDAVLAERFEDAMTVLAQLRRPIDEFFERVTVNADDRDLRENRLRLLSRIRAVMNQVADFSQIEG